MRANIKTLIFLATLLMSFFSYADEQVDYDKMVDSYISEQTSAEELAKEISKLKDPNDFYSVLEAAVIKITNSDIPNATAKAEKLVYFKDEIFAVAKKRKHENTGALKTAGAIAGGISVGVYMSMTEGEPGSYDQISGMFYAIGYLFKYSLGLILGATMGTLAGDSLGSILPDQHKFHDRAKMAFYGPSCNSFL